MPGTGARKQPMPDFGPYPLRSSMRWHTRSVPRPQKSHVAASIAVHTVPYHASFLLHSEVMFAATRGQVTSIAEDKFTLQVDTDEDVVLPRRGCMCQDQMDCRPQGVSAALLVFWNPVWNHDPERVATGNDKWPLFQEPFAELRPLPRSSFCLTLPSWHLRAFSVPTQLLPSPHASSQSVSHQQDRTPYPT